MAERRMFSSKITESDDFLDLPVTAQNLYFHMNMNADDRGFVDNPRSVMRMCGASNGDAQALLNAKFMLGFDGKNVLLVKHWKIHNYIRADRMHESSYVNLLKSIYFDENGGYSKNIEHQNKPVLSDNCQPTDGQMTGNCHTEVRLELELGNSKVIDRLDRKKEEKEERKADIDLSALNIPEETLKDLESLKENCPMIYETAIEQYRKAAME